jgi:small subunit ribosomal protein S2
MPTNLQELHDAGVHLGHQLRRFNPRSKKFVYDHRQGISIIDLEKTLAHLTKACDFIRNTVAHGKKVLLVGTKKEAQEVVKEIAVATGMPYAVSRWVGGTLTNYGTISASLKKFKKHQAMDADGSLDKMHNKEAAAIRREMTRQLRYFEGLLELTQMPGAVFVVDVKEETNVVAEAKLMRIPVVAIVDTNSDPTGIQFPIPGNDDALKSIRLLASQVREAIEKGLEEKALRKVEKTDVPSEQVPSFEAPAYRTDRRGDRPSGGRTFGGRPGAPRSFNSNGPRPAPRSNGSKA